MTADRTEPQALTRWSSLARLRASVIVLHESTVLLVHDPSYRGGCWIAPGGGIEFTESIIDGALREVMEETSLPVKMNGFWRMREIWENDPDSVNGSTRSQQVRKTLEVVFTAELQPAVEVDDNHASEFPDRRWVPIEHLHKLLDGEPIWLPEDLIDALQQGLLETLPLNTVLMPALQLDGKGPPG